MPPPCFNVSTLCFLPCRWWSSDEFGIALASSQEHASLLYTCFYLVFCVLFILLLLCRDGFFSAWHIGASARLHNALFSTVLKVCGQGPVWRSHLHSGCADSDAVRVNQTVCTEGTTWSNLKALLPPHVMQPSSPKRTITGQISCQTLPRHV